MMDSHEEDRLPTSYHGIELRHWEVLRLRRRQETLSDTINRILALGLRVRQRMSQGLEPGERELGILRRTRQILVAASQSTLVYITCSKRLLRDLDFDGFPAFADDSWLPELEDWDQAF